MTSLLRIRVDNSDWVEYEYESCEFDWTSFSYDWADIVSNYGVAQNPETVRFRFRTYYRYRLYSIELDNFVLVSSPFDGLEISQASESLIDYFPQHD